MGDGVSVNVMVDDRWVCVTHVVVGGLGMVVAAHVACVEWRLV